MPFKAVIFDIGGVVVGSPLTGVAKAEKAHNLPHHYLNALITDYGEYGAFQAYERGRIDTSEFAERFHEQMNDTQRGNKAYTAYARRKGIDVPLLPEKLDIDGGELWTLMMAETFTPDPVVIEAIERIRKNGNYKIAALTNNFAPSDPEDRSGESVVRELFDHYIESSVVGKRKPDPEFYRHALKVLGVEASEAVFLDDIGHNLKAAQDLGISTIRVLPGQSEDAIRELGKRIGLDLLAGQGKAKL